jgi:hypothetical protein
MPKDFPSERKTFPERKRPRVGRDAFRQRFRAALSRRLHPHTTLTRKALARAIGRTPETIENYLSGYSHPDSHVMGELMAFFDPGFGCEVYEGHGLMVMQAEDLGRACTVLRHVNYLAPMLATIEELIGSSVSR